MTCAPFEGALSGIMLAGGQSRRMGRDKAELLVGGVPVWKRVLAALRGAGVCELLAVGGPPERFADGGARHVPDNPPGFGVVGGIATGLEAMRGGAGAVLGCDMPFLTGAMLRRLAARVAGGLDGAAAETAAGLEPLCAVYRRSAAPAFRAMAAEGDFAVRGIAQRVRLARVRFSGGDARRLLNMNAPSDHARAESLAPELDAGLTFS